MAAVVPLAPPPREDDAKRRPPGPLGGVVRVSYGGAATSSTAKAPAERAEAEDRRDGSGADVTRHSTPAPLPGAGVLVDDMLGIPSATETCTPSEAPAVAAPLHAPPPIGDEPVIARRKKDVGSVDELRGSVTLLAPPLLDGGDGVEDGCDEVHAAQELEPSIDTLKCKVLDEFTKSLASGQLEQKLEAAFVHHPTSGDVPAAMSDLQAQFSALQSELEALRKENAELRHENAMLREASPLGSAVRAVRRAASGTCNDAGNG